MIDWESRAAALADRLVASGALTDPDWRDAFAAVPRHAFVPRYWAYDEDSRATKLVDRDSDYATWADAIYRDNVLVTLHSGDPDRTPISSSSAPSAIALMLEALDARPGDRVLEIGTGTGYNAALLGHRVGDHAVTSIDIDAGLVDLAAARLESLGMRPTLVVGDGIGGAPGGAPYDRIIATCATTGIPPSWVAQLAPGGRIVAPMTFGGALPVLGIAEPGTASGHFHRIGFGFMPLHPPGVSAPDGLTLPVPDSPDDPGSSTTTTLDETELGNTSFVLWLSLDVPDIRLVWERDAGGDTRTGLTVHTATRRATVTFAADGGHRVRQGTDRLFDDVTRAWRRWQLHGRPVRERLGLTATMDGSQHVWLDSPAGAIRWPVPA